MTSSDVLDMFRACGALLEGHFRLTSGLHSTGYLQSALVLQYPARAEQLGQAIARLARGHGANAVLSPALGGIVIGHEVARALGVRALFAERRDGPLALRRGFVLRPGDRVLVVEDVMTTGGSTRETMAVAQALGAEVVAAAAIIDRGAQQLGVPFHALAGINLPTFEESACPRCREGVPIDRPGSRPQ